VVYALHEVGKVSLALVLHGARMRTFVASLIIGLSALPFTAHPYFPPVSDSYGHD
jgi:hypothetical protein